MEKLRLNSCGVWLDLMLQRPETSQAGPLLLLLHGVTGNKRERHLEGIAEAAIQEGFSVLRGDFSGHGLSGGCFEDHTIDIWVRNVLDLLSYVRTLPFVTKVYLSGHSQGGLAVMLAAAEQPAWIDGLILLSPAWMIPEQARQGHILGHEFDPNHLPQRLPLKADLALGREYLSCAQGLDPISAMEAYPGPVLIIQGTADATVPWEYGKLAAERYSNAELSLIGGDTHCYDLHLREVEAAVGAWLKKQCADE